MVKLNKHTITERTHEGAPAKRITPIQELRRTVLSCLLWEDQFYENGEDIGKRITDLCHKVTAEELASLAVEARDKYKLRHAPLVLVRELARHPGIREKVIISTSICNVIQRADELTEFLAIYWKDGRQPLSAQVKKGLAKAFKKFGAYALAKYNRDGPIKLRDVLFLSHAKPNDKDQERVWMKLIDGTLEAPDTWEVSLSSGNDKKETFTRLLSENKLGYMALLRNLRNMVDSGVDRNLITSALIDGAKTSKALPFRFISAAKHCISLERELDEAMQLSLSTQAKLDGKTIVLCDVSGSMDWAKVSSRSEITRREAGAALAALVSGISDHVDILTFANTVSRVPPRKGMALIDAIMCSQSGGTDLGLAVKLANKEGYDRLIVFTDEQSNSRVPDPVGRGYIVNVASYKNGVGYGAWTHIDGFSEAVIDYIQEVEQEGL